MKKQQTLSEIGKAEQARLQRAHQLEQARSRVARLKSVIDVLNGPEQRGLPYYKGQISKLDSIAKTVEGIDPEVTGKGGYVLRTVMADHVAYARRTFQQRLDDATKVLDRAKEQLPEAEAALAECEREPATAAA